MFRDRRFVRPVLALIAVGVLALALGGCAYLKPNSLALSQPQGIGSVRVHFELCTLGDPEFCGPNEESETVQYLIGIAVPPGSVPPDSFTAVPVGGGAPIVFSRNETVASEIAVSSTNLQKLLAEVDDPEEKKFVEALGELLGSAWPPSGLQGVGYLSAPVVETEGASVEWSVDADFALPPGAGGAPFPGPFAASIAYGFRLINAEQPASRPVHCLRWEEGSGEDDDAYCVGAIQQAQIGTADLRIGKPAKVAKAFVGGKGRLSFPLNFAGAPATPPTFTLSATTTAKGGKATPAPGSFTPGATKPTDKVTVAVPRRTKPGTYQVTLTAATPQGGTATQVGKLKVTKPKLRFGAARLDAGKGTATLRVKVPSGGRLTISGKGVTKVKKRAKKAKTLKVKISAAGSAGAELERTGSVKVKLKAKFKPSSGIAVAKTKGIVLKRD